MRATKQRSAIVDALDSARGFRSAQQLHDELKRAGASVGLTTVYRTLQAMAESGRVDALRRDDGETIYRRCGSDEHHHHLVCRDCGTSVELANDEVEAWAEGAARRHGFTQVTHTAELYGFCRDCSSSRSS